MFPVLSIASDGHKAAIVIDHMVRQVKRLHDTTYQDCWGNQYVLIQSWKKMIRLHHD